MGSSHTFDGKCYVLGPIVKKGGVVKRMANEWKIRVVFYDESSSDVDTEDECCIEDVAPAT